MASQRRHNYGLLEQAQEDALHASRLLQVEERPFQRVTRALLGKDSLLRAVPRQLPSPPPEGEEGSESTIENESLRRQKFREELLLDFAALESSIIRIQLIQSSNQRERERYAAEKAKILDTAQAVKENSIQLRIQLEEAQKIMLQRKGYDDLAAKILDDTKIHSRDESRAEIEKLEKEIEDLQQESAEYDLTWEGRREQFERVVAEGQAMIRLIKGIKDEVEEEKEEAEGGEDGEEDDEDEKGKTGISHVGTPAPGGHTPMTAPGGYTPMPGGNADEDEDADISTSAPYHSQHDTDMADSATSQVVSQPRDEAMEGMDET